MIILGLHKDPWHNTGAAIVKVDGGVRKIVMVSEERFDRVKDSRSFPRLSIEACMHDFDVKDIGEFDLVVLDYIVSKDWRNDRFKKPCEIDTLLEKVDPEKIRVIDHHLSHACSVYYSSGFKDSAILVVDGRGSSAETQSLYVARKGEVKLVERTEKIGIGLLYAAVTQAIGFGLLQEGKTMGLAPYGANVQDRIFNFGGRYEGISTDYSAICVEGSYELRGIDPEKIKSFDQKARAAYEVQLECEQAMLHLAKYAREETGLNHLCISGGVGLNSVANYQILSSGIFKDVFINPACSDTGIPLGNALWGCHMEKGNAYRYGLISPYTGPSYTEESYKVAAARTRDHGCEILQGRDVIKEFAKLLTQNKIGSICWGRSEMGPRALGNRSIVMSPTRSENKDILNSRVKHREAFRPFAPVVLEERVTEYFEIDRPSPYMLFVPYVKKHMRSKIPAVTHADGTGRLQTVSSNSETIFRKILEYFYEMTDIPVLLNTSFNVNKEPIVESPEDAVRCFLSTDIDFLLLGNEVLVKKKGI